MRIEKYNYWRREDRRNLSQIKETKEIENNSLDPWEKFLFVKYEIYKLKNGEYALFKTIPLLCLVLYSIILFFLGCAFAIQEGYTEIRECITRIKKYEKAKKIK